MIQQSKWKWFGNHGHFICGRWCRFHLCTQVGRYLVSTVGQYVHPSKSGGNEKSEAEWLADNPNGQEIGYERFYETMVFKRIKGKCDSPACRCGMPHVDFGELDSSGYQNAGDATNGHLRMCLKWARKQ